MTTFAKAVFSMTSTALTSGSPPGDAYQVPDIIYLSDLKSYYVRCPDDTVDPAGNKILQDAAGGLWAFFAGIDGVSIGAAAQVELFDDFLGDVIADQWSGAGGSDAQALAPTVDGAVGGRAVLVGGNVGNGDDSVDASVLTQALQWKANQDNLSMECVIQVDDITTVAVFAGFTDVLGTTTVEFPIELGSGDTPAANAANACGIVFDTAADTDEIGAVGVKATTETAATFAGEAMINDTDVTLRVDVDDAGTMTAYLNGTLFATIADAVTVTTALTPVVAVMTRAVASRTVKVDYVSVRQDR